jgi:hypothetical protein
MPWIDIIAGHLRKGNCALLTTNSTTSKGWLQKSNFIEVGDDPIQATIQLKVACLHATHYHSTCIREYSQWFHGADNNIANALSWAWLAMSGFVSVGYTPKTTDICVCRRHVNNVGPTRR